MQIFIIAFAVFCIAMLLMGIGLFFGRKPIQRGCGGGKRPDDVTSCDQCSEEERAQCDKAQD